MNKNIIKIIIKTSISVIIIGLSMIVIFASLAEDDVYTGTMDDSLNSDYKNGRYDFIMDSFTNYDASDDKYNDDWKVIEVYKLRYDYDIYEKIHENTKDKEYLEKMDDVKKKIEACIDEIEDDYKKDVARMFLDEIE